jgi:hypothetical protein
MVTAVGLYNLESFNNDWNLRWNPFLTSIGSVLSSNKNALEPVVLFDGRLGTIYKGEPVVLKLGERVYEFCPDKSKGNVLQKSMANCDWNKLTDKKTVLVRPEEVAKYKSPDAVHPELAAERLLVDKLKEEQRDVALFSNNQGMPVLTIPKTAMKGKTVAATSYALFSELQRYAHKA